MANVMGDGSPLARDAEAMSAGVRWRRVTARALIAAPRERVWARLQRERARRRRAFEAIAAWGVDRGAVARRLSAVGSVVDEQVVAWAPPYRYQYRLPRMPLFRAYTGRILLGEYQRSTTEVAWMIAFQAALPGTDRLAQWVLQRLIDTALLRLKRELENC